MAKTPHRWESDLRYQIHRTTALMERRIEEALSMRGRVSLAQFAILYALSKERSMTQHRISTILELTEATVSRHIDALHKMKLVSRRVDPENRRAYLIALLPKGRAEYRSTCTMIDRETRNIFSGTTAKDRAAISMLLDRIAGNLSTSSS